MYRTTMAVVAAPLLLGLMIACGWGDDIDPDVSQSEADASSAVATATPNVGRLEARGKLLAREKGCVGCHTIDGRDQVGPSWMALYGSSEILDGGTSLEVDVEYLRTSILDPNANIVEGYLPDIMPSYDLTSVELDSLVEYIRSLR